MTAQTTERLRIDGRVVSMCALPLDTYFLLADNRPEFLLRSTALWRGYVGEWEILGDRLYLTGINALLEDGSPADLETLFPRFPDRVFAHWYTGRIRAPEGKLLRYVHLGFSSQYERDHLIRVERGEVRDVETRVNGRSDDPDAPDGYVLGGATWFPKGLPSRDDRK